MDDVAIRIATVGDRDDAASSLSSAFAADPIMGWMTRTEPLDAARLRRFFETIVDGELQKESHVTYVAGTGGGAAVWRDVGDKGPSTGELLKSAPRFVRVFGLGLARAMRLAAAVDRSHPKEPHVYLFFVGVHQDRRGRGVGASLLAPVLERCDREGVPAYLENSNPSNEAFYARLGFVPRGSISLPKGAPPLTPMWRDPRSG